MQLLEFMRRFSDEQSCREYYREVRLKQGVVCKKCGCIKHYWLSKREVFECSNCKFRTSLRNGTVMQGSPLPFKTWFLIMYLMTYQKKSISACEVTRQLGHKRYTTIWNIMHKIRSKMGKRDFSYQLKDMIEYDDAYFEKATPEKVKKALKRGKGSQKQAKVAVMAESVPLEMNNKQTKYCGFFKMKVLDNEKAETVDQVVQESIHSKSIIFSDKSTSYVNISDYVEAHYTFKSSEQTTKTDLRWVHIAISNAKRNLLGIYHKISGKYLQNYLNEFVYKLNRRYFDSLFDRLLIAVSANYL